MKYFAPLTLVAMLFAATAHAQDNQDCVALAKDLNAQDRATYLKSCLAQKSAPVNVAEASTRVKLKYCQQNARNRGLSGEEAVNYVTGCLIENKAKDLYNKQSAQKIQVASSAPAAQ
jgi:hypothetical protein